MPQMAPLSWLMLFILFISLLLLTSMKIFFSKKQIMNESIYKNTGKLIMNPISWKW